MTEEAQGEAQQQGEQPAPPQQQQSDQGSETPPAGAEWAQEQQRAQAEGAEEEQKTSGDIAQEQGGGSGETFDTQGGGLKAEAESAEGQSAVAPLEGGEPQGATFAREQAERFERPGQAEREAREKEEQQG